ncbi:CDP-glycerol glycerophosphotransferase (TagB/SpsB family) [Bacilli bacterium PM5-3]|nr:CDP-glycerol glycerophosphotransferase (TagB/SpsB family) [Bacilli bacterium PM5-3]MDH6603426.1 CDP-glycerol glycerophosphotransferase (TagB/SpsB family) [Bacilli bacterium PM5-9]
MKKIEVFIARVLVYITYYLTLLLPIKNNQVTIISYFNNDLGLEFSKLSDILIADGYIVKQSLHKFKSNALGKLSYLFSFIYQTYLFNTSKVIVLDGNNFVFSTINVKKDVKTIQLWHATGAIKQFGINTSRRYEIKGYDSLIVSSSFFKEIFAKALNTDINNVHDLGVCKTDYLFDNNFIMERKKEFYLKYPDLVGKKIVLYAPTFRGEGIEDMKFDGNINDLDAMLGEDYQVAVKLHPLIKSYDLANVMDFTNEDLYTLLCVSEYVISDYSALIFDAAILNKKIILYLYDLDNYTKERGLCLNIDELLLQKSYTIDNIYDIIIENNVCINNAKFIEKYLSAIDGNSTIRIANHIKKIIKEER